MYGTLFFSLQNYDFIYLDFFFSFFFSPILLFIYFFFIYFYDKVVIPGLMLDLFTLCTKKNATPHHFFN